MKSHARVLAIVAILTVALPGCGAPDDTSRPGQLAVAAFFPLAWATQQVAGDSWTVTNLTQVGAEPHDLSLSIAQTADLDEADVVVYEHNFQPQVDEAVDNVAGGTVVDAAEAVDLSLLDGTDEADPHFWQDPLLMADLADAVADALADADAEGASTYHANARELRTRLEQLDTEFREGLANCQRDTVVVSHEAFGYLERYGLRFRSIAGLSPEAEPTPAALAELEDLIRAEGITTVFSERLASPAMAESLASDTGAQSAVLDPIEGPGGGDAAGDYVALMQQNLVALQEANAC